MPPLWLRPVCPQLVSAPVSSSVQRFIQYLASRNTLFNLNNFLDKGALQGNPPTPTPASGRPRDAHQQTSGSSPFPSPPPTGYDMSTFLRRYSYYLNEKAVSYRLVAVDFTKMKRG